MQSKQFIKKSVSPQSELLITDKRIIKDSDSNEIKKQDVEEREEAATEEIYEEKTKKQDGDSTTPTFRQGRTEVSSKESTRGRPSACVFVASLCSTRSDDELCLAVTEHFQQWGELSTVKVLRDTANRPYAFVQYSNDKDSKFAIREGHNSVLNGRNIRCEAAKVNRTLFITSRSTITESEVREVLGDFGEIEQLICSNEYGNIYTMKKGFKNSKSWFCKFVYRDDAIRAFANLTESSTLKVEWTQNIEETDSVDSEKLLSEDHSKPRFDKYSIFVGQLSQKITEEDLKERFELHGEIADIVIIRRPINTISFIKFKEEASAASAVERENHAMFNGKTMHVQYREIHPYSNKPTTSKSSGIALAPPPINLNRRSISSSNGKTNNTFVTRKVSGGHNTFPMSKPKFNGHSFNNFNRSKNNYYKNGFINQQPKSFGINSRGGTSAATKGQKSYRFNEFEYSKSKENLEPGEYDVQTPPQSVQTSDSHTMVKSGYSPSSAVNSERSDYVKPGKKDIHSTKHEIANPNIPYFYYIPNTELNGGIGNKFSTPQNYYNPYQHFYLPYEPNQHQGGYRIPSFPIFYSATGNGPEFNNFMPLDKEQQ